jgi:hypothetical protein
MKNKILWMLGLSFCVFAQEGWAETSVSLNPKMSVIMDLLAQSGTTGDPSQTGDGVTPMFPPTLPERRRKTTAPASIGFYFS